MHTPITKKVAGFGFTIAKIFNLLVNCERLQLVRLVIQEQRSYSLHSAKSTVYGSH